MAFHFAQEWGIPTASASWSGLGRWRQLLLGGGGYLVAGDDETTSERDSCMGMTTFGPRLVHVMGGWVQSEEIDEWRQITAPPGYSKRNHLVEDLATGVHGRG